MKKYFYLLLFVWTLNTLSCGGQIESNSKKDELIETSPTPISSESNDHEVEIEKKSHRYDWKLSLSHSHYTWAADNINNQNLSMFVHTDENGDHYLTGTYQSQMSIWNQTQSLHLVEEFESYNKIFIQKISKNGELQWIKKIEGDDISQEADNKLVVRSTLLGPDQSIYILADFKTGKIKFPDGDEFSINGTQNSFLIKILPDGDIAWKFLLGGNGEDGSQSLLLGPNGNILIAGSFRSPLFKLGLSGTITQDVAQSAFLAAINPDNGQVIWTKRFGASNDNELLHLIEGPEDTLYFVVKEFMPQENYRNLKIYKINSNNGSILKNSEFTLYHKNIVGGSIKCFYNNQDLWCVINSHDPIHLDGELIFSNPNHNRTVTIVRFDENLVPKMDRTIASLDEDPNSNVGFSQLIPFNHHFIILGTLAGGSKIYFGNQEIYQTPILSCHEDIHQCSRSYYFVAAYDHQGKFKWKKTFGGIYGLDYPWPNLGHITYLDEATILLSLESARYLDHILYFDNQNFDFEDRPSLNLGINAGSGEVKWKYSTSNLNLNHFDCNNCETPKNQFTWSQTTLMNNGHFFQFSDQFFDHFFSDMHFEEGAINYFDEGGNLLFREPFQISYITRAVDAYGNLFVFAREKASEEDEAAGYLYTLIKYSPPFNQ